MKVCLRDQNNVFRISSSLEVESPAPNIISAEPQTLPVLESGAHDCDQCVPLCGFC